MIDLYPYQQEDVDHLGLTPSVLIGNEMGTGKTHEAIARDAKLREAAKGQTLVIAPLITLELTWQRLFETHTDLKVVTIDEKSRNVSWDRFVRRDADVFLAHWQVLRIMPELGNWSWMHVIADECHRMKNRKAVQTRSLKTIRVVEYKTAMSGTPFSNRPDELWSVLNWLYPKKYSSYWRFFNEYVETEVGYARGGRTFKKVVGPKNEKKLQAEIRPFFVRRLKKDVLPQLPDKYYDEIHVDLTPMQRKAYDDMKDDMIAWVGQQEEEVLAAPVVIAQLMRLQQFAVAYAEIDPQGKVRLSEPSSKLDAVMEVLDALGDRQAVIFSGFKDALSLMEHRLRAERISFVTITGDTPKAERTPLVQRFQRGSDRIFLGTPRAGGEGIDLFTASTVIFIDRDWAPYVNSQAEDRLHRIGQKDAVQVIDIMAKKTVDRGKQQTLETKKDWFRRMIGDI